MNYAEINPCDFNNGDGIRVSLWVSGCPLKCKGCHNSQLWEQSFGKKFTDENIKEILDLLNNDYISGLSVLGGEPLAPYNRDTVLDVCKKVKNEYPSKDIWLWTGYEWDIVKDLEIIDVVDYIVWGSYKENLKGNYKYFGSSNQKIYHHKKDITDIMEKLID